MPVHHSWESTSASAFGFSRARRVSRCHLYRGKRVIPGQSDILYSVPNGTCGLSRERAGDGASTNPAHRPYEGASTDSLDDILVTTGVGSIAHIDVLDFGRIKHLHNST